MYVSSCVCMFVYVCNVLTVVVYSSIVSVLLQEIVFESERTLFCKNFTMTACLLLYVCFCVCVCVCVFAYQGMIVVRRFVRNVLKRFGSVVNGVVRNVMCVSSLCTYVCMNCVYIHLHVYTF